MLMPVRRVRLAADQGRLMKSAGKFRLFPCLIGRKVDAGHDGLCFAMLQNLAVGSSLVALSVLIHTAGLVLIAAATPPVARRLGFNNHDVGRTLVMTGTVLGIFCVLTIEVWSWAVAYAALGVAADFTGSLYLSTAMFSTIGNNQVPVNSAWRLLTVLEGVAGFLLIGWSTAYLVRAATRHGPFRGEHF